MNTLIGPIADLGEKMRPAEVKAFTRIVKKKDIDELKSTQEMISVEFPHENYNRYLKQILGQIIAWEEAKREHRSGSVPKPWNYSKNA